MKCIGFSLFVFSVCCLQLAELSTDKKPILLDRIRHDCVKQTGVDASVLERARKFDYVDDQKLKEHVLCVALKHGFVKDGKLQHDAIVKKIGQIMTDGVLAAELYANCSEDKGSILETAFATAKCFLKVIRINIL
ncbi:unnamed protein product [Phyllotreta striolata]|uniref:Uncharacterized protein n=1 Tax=Phyllotreta striolata TaxID=444603 RepID=A0A9N9TIM3_PHYSR|nr:unnamed protein product [Phyllotreta striolata]